MPSQLQEALVLDSQTRAHLTTRLLERARQQGFLLPRNVREILTEEGLDRAAWREVLAACRPQLRYKQGRYYPLSPMVLRLHQAKQNQRAVQRAVHQLIRRQRAAQAQVIDRRRHARRPFFQAVTILTADGRVLRMCSCDISVSGIRLIGVHNLQGSRVRLEIPPMEEQGEAVEFVLHILWAKPVADQLFENGGVFESLTSK